MAPVTADAIVLGMPVRSPTVNATLQRFRALLDERFGARVRALDLFGSWARDEATEDSDVDVLVVIDGLTEDERSEVYALASRADAPNEWLVLLSPLPYSSQQAEVLRRGGRRLWRDVDREGISLLSEVAR